MLKKIGAISDPYLKQMVIKKNKIKCQVLCFVYLIKVIMI